MMTIYPYCCKAWGDNHTLQALSNIYNIEFIIHRTGEQNNIILPNFNLLENNISDTPKYIFHII